MQIGLQIGICVMQLEGIGCMGWGIRFHRTPPNATLSSNFICNPEIFIRLNAQDLQISKEGIEHAEIARLAFTRPLAVSPVPFGWSQRTVRVTLNRSRNTGIDQVRRNGMSRLRTA